MEKITRSSKGISKKQQWFTVTSGRVLATALLASAIFSVTTLSPMRAGAAAQAAYRNVAFSAGPNPSAAKIGDLDNDGLNDIVVVNLQGSLQLFFNTGGGSFERITLNGQWPSTASTLDVDIGDLNSDGRNDIAVAFTTQSGAVSVLLNRGNRTFAAPINYNLCGSSKGVAIGDFDLDGDNDLADISQCSRAGILLNSGQGNFVFNGAYGNGSASKAIALADFNRDGFKDIAYVNNVVSGSITVVLNNRNGTFSAPMQLYAGDLPDDVTTGDFDGDGHTDLAIANSYYSQIILLFNDSATGFSGYSEIDGWDTPTSIASADFNGDGRMDIAATSWGTSRLYLLTNQGNYNFSGQIFTVGQHPVDVAAGKLDGDALPDLVAVNQGSGTITVLFSAGGTPLPSPLTLTVSTRTTSRARLVDLKWSGAAGAGSIDIYRNGSRLTTVSNTGVYTDEFNKRATGTFRYKVCVAGGQDCSSEVTIRF